MTQCPFSSPFDVSRKFETLSDAWLHVSIPIEPRRHAKHQRNCAEVGCHRHRKATRCVDVLVGPLKVLLCPIDISYFHEQTMAKYPCHRLLWESWNICVLRYAPTGFPPSLRRPFSDLTSPAEHDEDECHLETASEGFEATLKRSWLWSSLKRRRTRSSSENFIRKVDKNNWKRQRSVSFE